MNAKKIVGAMVYSYFSMGDYKSMFHMSESEVMEEYGCTIEQLEDFVGAICMDVEEFVNNTMLNVIDDWATSFVKGLTE